MADDVAVKPAEGQEQAGKPPEIKALEDQLAKEKEYRLASERALTRQSREMSEQRKMLDNIYANQFAPKQEKVDFFANPEQAFDQRINQHPTIQGLAQAAQTLRAQQMQASLAIKHPDYKEVAQSEDFLKWVQKHHKRGELYWKADQEYDYNSADYLLSEFKERQENAANAKAQAKEDAKNDADLKAAKVPTGGSGTGSKRTWTSDELMELRRTNPDRYNSLGVADLYAKGLVKRKGE